MAGRGGREARPVGRVAGLSILSYTLDDECTLERNTRLFPHRVARSPERATKGETLSAVGGLSPQNTTCDLMNPAVMISVFGSRGRRSVACGGRDKGKSQLGVGPAHFVD